MKTIALITGVALIAGATGYWYANHRALPAPTSAERKPLYWYDPMQPNQHFDQPGKSPFMDMELVPKYADDAGDAGTIAIDPRVVQNLGLRTATVERGEVSTALQVPASVMIDERRIEVIQSRAAGWVEALHVRAMNDTVHRGELLAELYAPDLLLAQQELLLAEKAHDDALTGAARERLTLLGVSAAQIAQLEKTQTPSRRVAYYAPFDAVVAELGVREGAQVGIGQTLFKLADLSKVWIVAEVPEAQAAPARVGTSIVAELSGQHAEGKIDYVYPDVAPETRTVKVRASLDNPQLLLKPGMFARATIGGGGTREALLIPSEALIRTGTRTVVIVAEDEGRFRPAEVKVGAETGGRSEILEGLAEGDEVVSSGQFLIDSEANLRGALSRLTPEEKQP